MGWMQIRLWPTPKPYTTAAASHKAPNSLPKVSGTPLFRVEGKGKYPLLDTHYLNTYLLPWNNAGARISLRVSELRYLLGLRFACHMLILF